jgi:hypothetical protein
MTVSLRENRHNTGRRSGQRLEFCCDRQAPRIAGNHQKPGIDQEASSLRAFKREYGPTDTWILDI